MPSPTPTFPRDLLRTTAQSWDLPLSPAQLDQFERYAAELVRWNAERANLTTIIDPAGIVVRHFLDSLTLARVWPSQPPASLVDIGTGAGFPGLPLKLLWPDLRLLLVESIGKKIEFLAHMVDTLGLTDVDLSSARAEVLGHDPRFREQFEAATARAVAPLNVLAEYCLPLCKVDGVLVAPKSADGPAEAEAARRALDVLGGRLEPMMPVALPGVEPRTLIVVRKVQATPQNYPRRTGVPSKRPL